jgi:hypothetical protein
MSQRKNLCTLQLAGLPATKFEEELRLHDGLSLLSVRVQLERAEDSYLRPPTNVLAGGRPVRALRAAKV